MIKSHITQIKASATLAINEKSSQLQNMGKEVFRLGFGQSPFPVPETVVETLREFAAEKDYLPVKGLPRLRKAIANWINQRTNGNYTSENVLVSPGSKELLFLTQVAFKGDLVLLSPSWVSYEPQALITLHNVHRIVTHERDGYLLLPDELEKFCQMMPNGPKILLLNYPGNPSGTSYSSETLERIAIIARQYQIIILSDEIYGEVHHLGNHYSIAQYYPEGTIISTGISKWCGAGGWRLGSFIFPKELFALRNAIATIASETYTTASAPIQYAASAAFEGNTEISAYVVNSRIILRYIGNYMHEELAKMQISSPLPNGGFYLFINFGFYKEILSNNGIVNSTTLCARLLDETGIALLPGIDFGRPDDELTARLSYVDFDGRKALDSLKSGELLNEKWMKSYGGKMVKALDLLKEWLIPSH